MAAPRRSSARARHGRDARLGLRLPYRPPLAWDNLLSFLGDRAVPGVEEVVGGTYRRAVRVKEAVAVVEVEHVAPVVVLRVESPPVRGLASIVERCKGAFDLGADPAEIEAAFRGDAILAPLVARAPACVCPGHGTGSSLPSEPSSASR